jgi:integrase/recombinase XerC
LGRVELAGAARLELVSGVAQLRPEDAMFEAMLRGWRAQQTARGLREDTMVEREQLIRRFLEFTNEYPWNWLPGHVEEFTLSLIGERHLAPSTVRGYQVSLRLFSELLVDDRYGWAAACEEAFGVGVHPVAICHEWNTIAHLNDYEGDPEARPFSRAEMQRFLDYADDQVDRAVRAGRKGALAAYRDATIFKVMYGWGAAAHRDIEAGSGGLGSQSGGAGAGMVRDVAGALWQGQAGPGAPAAQRRFGYALGGRRGDRLRGERQASFRGR